MAKYMFSKYVDYQFDPLDPDEEISYDKYCGPTPESNWVIPNRLLVGAYPASADDPETFRLLTSIMKLGITKFVCLQLEYRSNGVTETMWRNGQALRPYFEDVKKIAKNRHRFIQVDGQCPIAEESSYSFVHFPIKDCSVTDDDIVVELSFKLVLSLSANEKIYIHCWGGHGRTGTIVSIMLHIMYGLSATECMRRCQMVHDLREAPVVVGSPQTLTQRNQVIRVIAKLQQQSSIPKAVIKNKITTLTTTTAISSTTTLSEFSESKRNNNNNNVSNNSSKSNERKSSNNITIQNSIISNNKESSVAVKNNKSSRPIQCPIINLTSNNVERTKNRITTSSTSTTSKKKSTIYNQIKDPPDESTVPNDSNLTNSNTNDVTMTENEDKEVAVIASTATVYGDNRTNTSTINSNSSDAMELQGETFNMEIEQDKSNSNEAEEEQTEKMVAGKSIASINTSKSSNEDQNTDYNSTIFRSFSDIMCPAGAPLVVHLRSESSSGGAFDDFQKSNDYISPPLSPQLFPDSSAAAAISTFRSPSTNQTKCESGIANISDQQPSNSNSKNINYGTLGLVKNVPRPLQPPNVDNLDSTNTITTTNSLSSYNSPAKATFSAIPTSFQTTPATTASTANTPSSKPPTLPVVLNKTPTTINYNGYGTVNKNISTEVITPNTTTNSSTESTNINELLNQAISPYNNSHHRNNHSIDMNLSNSNSSNSNSYEMDEEVNTKDVNNSSVTLSFSGEDCISDVRETTDGAMCIDIPMSTSMTISPVIVVGNTYLNNATSSTTLATTTTSCGNSTSVSCNIMEFDDKITTFGTTLEASTKYHATPLLSSASVPSDVRCDVNITEISPTSHSVSSGGSNGGSSGRGNNGYLSDSESSAAVSAHRPELPMNSSSSSGLQGRRSHKPKHPHSSISVSDSPPISSSKSIRCESPTTTTGLLQDGIAVFLGTPLSIATANIEGNNMMSIVPSTPPGRNGTRPPLIAKRPAPV